MSAWPAWAVLLCVAFMTLMYLLCVFVTPKLAAEGEIDLIAFHDREHRKYALVTCIIFLLAIALNLAFATTGHMVEWLRESVFSIIALMPALAAYLFHSRRSQTLSASALALLATHYAIINCNVVGT